MLKLEDVKKRCIEHFSDNKISLEYIRLRNNDGTKYVSLKTGKLFDNSLDLSKIDSFYVLTAIKDDYVYNGDDVLMGPNPSECIEALNISKLLVNEDKEKVSLKFYGLFYKEKNDDLIFYEKEILEILFTEDKFSYNKEISVQHKTLFNAINKCNIFKEDFLILFEYMSELLSNKIVVSSYISEYILNQVYFYSQKVENIKGWCDYPEIFQGFNIIDNYLTVDSFKKKYNLSNIQLEILIDTFFLFRIFINKKVNILPIYSNIINDIDNDFIYSLDKYKTRVILYNQIKIYIENKKLLNIEDLKKVNKMLFGLQKYIYEKDGIVCNGYDGLSVDELLYFKNTKDYAVNDYINLQKIIKNLDYFLELSTIYIEDSIYNLVKYFIDSDIVFSLSLFSTTKKGVEEIKERLKNINNYFYNKNNKLFIDESSLSSENRKYIKYINDEFDINLLSLLKIDDNLTSLDANHIISSLLVFKNILSIEDSTYKKNKELLFYKKFYNLAYLLKSKNQDYSLKDVFAYIYTSVLLERDKTRVESDCYKLYTLIDYNNFEDVEKKERSKYTK